MDSITRKSDFYIEVLRPDYKKIAFSAAALRSVGEFGPNMSPMPLINYVFKESLATLDAGFSLTFTPEADDKGLTWFDKIHITDIVTIKELGKAKFVGRVADRRYSSRMTEEGPARTITISGMSLGNLLSSFTLIINTFLFDSSAFAETYATKLMARLSQMMTPGSQVAPILKTICDAFFDLVLETGNMDHAGMGVKSLIDHFVDFESELSSDIVMRYPMALSLYRTGENNIWSILSDIVTAPVNELFPRFDAGTGKYHIVFRQAPFEPSDWKRLVINRIPRLLITNCDFGCNDSEVYTYYLATVMGSPVDDKMAMSIGSSGYGKIAVRDEDKWLQYGYKPMLVKFKYFNKDDYETYSGLSSTMKKLSEMLKRWFEHNDEFLNGSMEFMTIDEHWRRPKSVIGLKDPRIGERLSFLEGEFYIEGVEHSWSYGEPMITKLNISRGYVYSNAGEMKSPIINPGRRVDAFFKRNIEPSYTESSSYKKWLGRL